MRSLRDRLEYWFVRWEESPLIFKTFCVVMTAVYIVGFYLWITGPDPPFHWLTK